MGGVWLCDESIMRLGIICVPPEYGQIEVVTRNPFLGVNLSDLIIHDRNDDGIDRRGFLQCMAWAGSGVVWSIAGGIPSSRAFGQKISSNAKGDFHFLQISDSHIG